MSATVGRAADELSCAARLLWTASPLLLLIGPLRATRVVSDLPRLRAGICAKLDAFVRQARAQRVDSPRITQAREVLAALIDQVVLTTPWGADAGWQTLGSVHPDENSSPSRRLRAISQASLEDPGMLELIGVANALGFSDSGKSPSRNSPLTPTASASKAVRARRYILLGAKGAGKTSARASMGAAAALIEENAGDENARREPFEGALIALRANDLLELGSDALASQARELRSQLDEFEATPARVLPLQLVLTKCDLLVGFTEWFGTCTRLDRDRALSLSLDPDRWADDLADLLLNRLLRERDAQRRFRITAFVLHVHALGQPLARFMQELQGASSHGVAEGHALPRRIFLTSATQEGPAHGAWLDRSTSGLELEQPVSPATAGPGQSFFLTTLMNEVLAEEASATQPQRPHGARSLPIFAAAAALLALGSAFGFWRLHHPASISVQVQHDQRFEIQSSQQIAARIAVPCIELVAGTFPFDRRAARDAPLEDFNRLFAPQGAFDSLYTQLRARRADLGQQDLERFRNATRIRDAFFPAGHKRLGLQFTLRLISMDSAIDHIDIELDGRALRFSRGNASPMLVSWPGAGGGARIEISPATLAAPLEYQGRWALFRLFDRATIKESGAPGHLSVAFDLGGKQAVFDVQSDGGASPFRNPEVQNFDCPI